MPLLSSLPENGQIEGIQPTQGQIRCDKEEKNGKICSEGDWCSRAER